MQEKEKKKQETICHLNTVLACCRKENRPRRRPRKRRQRKENHGMNVRVPSQIAVVQHHHPFLRSKCPTTCHQRKKRNQRMSGIAPTIEVHPVSFSIPR
jgi:hypothetical protein